MQVTADVAPGPVFIDGLGQPAQRLGPSQNVLTSHGSNFISLSPPNDPYGYYGAQYGYYTDLETGLQLLTNRYYDASSGRFLTRDPIGTAGGQNLYEYTSGNPVGGIDPSGLDGWLRDAVDGFSGWVSGQVDSAKQFLFERTPIVISWPVANGLDLATGLLHFPSAILHLGEGLGAYAGDPSKPENQIAAWGDVGTVCSLGLSGLLGYRAFTPAGRVSAIASRARAARGYVGLGTGTWDEAMAAGRQFLGRGFRRSSKGDAWLSADGLRQFRAPKTKGRTGLYQANFESCGGPRGSYTNNGHLDIRP